MAARIVRIKKEARALFWPWCAVTLAGALPFFFPNSSVAAKFNLLSFFFGLPILATLSLGNEFYHHTFSLWLTQPVSRMRLWSEKTGVMIAAVLSAGVVSGFAMFLFALPRVELIYSKAAALAYVLIIISSATFWTLAARSTAGAFVLIGFIWWAIYTFLRKVGSSELGLLPTPPAALLAAVTISLAALMFWLGARKLARFQVTGATSGEDLLMAGPSLMPEALADWFRCRPSGAVLNLIRKECRLLRPVWVIALLTSGYLALLAIFRLLPSPPVLLPETVREWAVLGPPAMTSIGLLGLSGMLSLGEERTSGTYAWHMTLPISTRTQWVIKLLVAMFAGFACSVLLPLLAMIAIGTAYGSPFMFIYTSALPDELIVYAILIFACFWCACAADATMRAATWAMPVIAAIPFASAGGLWLGRQVADATGTLKDLVIAAFHLSPLALATVTDFARSKVLWLFIPTLLLALIQSYWLFRTARQYSALRMLRSLAPLVALTILWSFSVSAGFLASHWEPFEETRRALDKLQMLTANREITDEQLQSAASLSASTRRWLAGSTIKIGPAHSALPGYSATIHLASGTECQLNVIRGGVAAASCAPHTP